MADMVPGDLFLIHDGSLNQDDHIAELLAYLEMKILDVLPTKSLTYGLKDAR